MGSRSGNWGFLRNRRTYTPPTKSSACSPSNWILKPSGRLQFCFPCACRQTWLPSSQAILQWTLLTECELSLQALLPYRGFSHAQHKRISKLHLLSTIMSGDTWARRAEAASEATSSAVVMAIARFHSRSGVSEACPSAATAASPGPSCSAHLFCERLEDQGMQ